MISMGYLRFFLVVSGVSMSFALSDVSIVYAETHSGQELYEATANLFGVDKNSRFYASLGEDEKSDKSKNPIEGGKDTPHKRGIDEGDEPLKIVRHYRIAGDGAVKLPTASEFRSPFLKLKPEKLKALARDLAKVGMDYLKRISDPEKLPFAPHELPNCTKSLTEKKRIALDPTIQKKLGLEEVGTKEDKEIVLFDYLILRKEDLPINPAEVFGKSAVVRVYEGKPMSAAGYAAAAVGAKCLPFRVRGTRVFAFRHQGFDALKNYDAQPTGNGKMHDLIKDKKKHQQR